MDRSPNKNPEIQSNEPDESPVDINELVGVSSNIVNLFRACTWPLPATNRKRKGKRLAKLLSLQRYNQHTLVNFNLETQETPSGSRALFSRAAMLAFKNLDLGSAPPNQLSKALNHQGDNQSSIPTRSASPPPSEFSSLSSDESAPRNGILTSKLSRRRTNHTVSLNYRNTEVVGQAEHSKNECIGYCETPGPNSCHSDVSSIKRNSARHHQVRIIDNRLKKPVDDENLLQSRRRLYLPRRSARSCTSNDDDDDAYDELYETIPGPSSAPPPFIVTPTAPTPYQYAPTSSILVINPSSATNGVQKHVTLLTGSSEPSPSSVRAPSEEGEFQHEGQIPANNTAATTNSIALPSPSTNTARNADSADESTERRRLSGSSNLKRCNTASSVHSGLGEHTPPTPVKSTLKNPSSLSNKTAGRRQRASLPAMQTRLLMSSPAASRQAISSDEVEEIGDVGVGGIGYGRFSTPMEPICVVNLATPISMNSIYNSDGAPHRRVNLLVEGVRFVMDVSRLQAHPDTMLGRMFHSSFLEVACTMPPPPSQSTSYANANADDDADAEDVGVEEEEETEISPGSSVCSNGSTHVVDVEHWMAAAAVSPHSSTSPSTRVLPVGGATTRSAPASYRSRCGSICAASASSRHRGQQVDIPVASGCGISANVFRVILDYYLVGRMSCPPGVSVRQLKKACEYFLVPFNHETVSCSNLREFLHEVSNDGAYSVFQDFLEEHIVPQFMKCAQLGERECHVVILMDDEQVHWDHKYPPHMPEMELSSHIVYSTQMYRFLKYIENREIAKRVLQERGLKKIRIGIEGYPTCKERMKFRVGSRPEAIYNYVQRPFLRMSWEQEENKSRHVDFQCVKSKSVSDLTSLDQAIIDRPPLGGGGGGGGAGRSESPRLSPFPASPSPTTTVTTDLLPQNHNDDSTHQPL